MKEALQNCLITQDVVPLISTSVEWNPEDCDNGHHGFVLSHEYAAVAGVPRAIRVHIGNCFNIDTLRAALNHKLDVRTYASLDELLTSWRVD